MSTKSVEADGGEVGERLIRVDRILPIDVSKTQGLETILAMLKEGAKRGRFVGITDGTTSDDLRAYYTQEGRHGYVGLNQEFGLVGVYDLKGPEIKRDIVTGGKEVEFKIGELDRLCVRTDLQGKAPGQGRSIGTQLVKDAMRRAHDDFGWRTLLAGIVLDEEPSDKIQQARHQGNSKPVEDEVYEKLRTTDARVRLFVGSQQFQFQGFSPNVDVRGKPREVLVVVHIDTWVREGSQPELL